MENEYIKQTVVDLLEDYKKKLKKDETYSQIKQEEINLIIREILESQKVLKDNLKK